MLKGIESTGLDNIPAKVLKIASRIIAPSLTFTFNLSLSSGIFTDDWKNARVSPIYKGNDRRDMGNYHMTRAAPSEEKRSRMRAVRVEVIGPEKHVRPYKKCVRPY